MRIAFIGQKGIPSRGGGIEKYAQDLSVRLAGLGHEVIAYSRPHYTDRTLKNFKGVRIINLPTIPTKHLDTITHSLLASIDVLFRKVDIVHYQNIGPALVSWIPRLFGRKLRIVSTLQSMDYKHKKWGLFARFSLHIGEHLLCRLSDDIIVITREMLDYVTSKYGNRNVHLIPNGTEFAEKKPADAIKAWGLEEGGYIVSISRLVPHKGISFLIEAFKRIETHQKLVIVGGGAFTDDYVDSLKSQAGGDQRIIFTGPQEGRALAELYSNASLFVQPSESEGMSLALLEAMSYGLPIIVSDIAENLEAIGDAGLVFKTKDAADLQERIIELLEDPARARELGSRAMDRAKLHYAWDAIVLEITKVYSQDRSLPDRQSGEKALAAR